jgi:hypothetical protein
MDGFGRYLVAAIKEYDPSLVTVLQIEGQPASIVDYRMSAEATKFNNDPYEKYVRIRLLDQSGNPVWSYSCRKSRISWLQIHGSRDPGSEDKRLAAREIAKHLKQIIRKAK